MSTMKIKDLEYRESNNSSELTGGYYFYAPVTSVSVDTTSDVAVRLSVGKKSIDFSYGFAGGLAAGISLNGRTVAEVSVFVG